jgi:hypothetical protein
MTALAVAAAEACEPPNAGAPGGRAESAGIVLVFQTSPAVIEVGRHFAVDVRLCAEAPAATLTRLDAEMPEHRHGMNYRATVAPAGDGRYVAEGLMFHMPGRWRLLFDVQRDGRRVRLAADVLVE